MTKVRQIEFKFQVISGPSERQERDASAPGLSCVGLAPPVKTEPPPRAQKAGGRQSGGVPWKAAADASPQACITAPQAHLSCYPWARSQ